MDEEIIEVLLVEHSDDGTPFSLPVLLVNDRMIRGEPNANGLLFRVPVDRLVPAERGEQP